MASGGVLTIIEENTYCTLCSSKGKKVAFNYYCIDCEVYYCNDCFEFHLRIPYLAKHIVLEKKEVEVWSNLQYKCKPHERNFEFFCRNHKKLCCHICVSLQHRSCDKIDYIPECAKDESLKKEVTSMIRRIDNNSQNISTREEKFKKKSSANEDSEQCCQKTITDYRKRINAMLDEIETKTKDIIGKKFEMNSSNFTENSEELRKFKCGLAILNQQLNTSSKGKEILVYIGLLEGETFVEDVERKLSRMDIANTKEDFELVLDVQLERCLKSISSFGYIKDKQMHLEEISSEEAEENGYDSEKTGSIVYGYDSEKTGSIDYGYDSEKPRSTDYGYDSEKPRSTDYGYDSEKPRSIDYGCDSDVKRHKTDYCGPNIIHGQNYEDCKPKYNEDCKQQLLQSHDNKNKRGISSKHQVDDECMMKANASPPPRRAKNDEHSSVLTVKETNAEKDLDKDVNNHRYLSATDSTNDVAYRYTEAPEYERDKNKGNTCYYESVDKKTEWKVLERLESTQQKEKPSQSYEYGSNKTEANICSYESVDKKTEWKDLECSESTLQKEKPSQSHEIMKTTRQAPRAQASKKEKEATSMSKKT